MKNPDKPLVSVIVPVYNVEKYLDECVESLVGQTYENLEIILIDDGSTDGSGGMCDDYASRDERIKVWHTKNNGVSVARNFGIERSSADYITFVDADDFLAVDAIEKLVAGVLAEPSVDISLGDVTVYHTAGYTEDPPKRLTPINQLFSVKSSSEKVISELLVDINSSFCKLIRKSLIVENNIIFSKDLRIAEDLEFISKTLFKSNKVYFIGEAIYFYRADFDNSSSAMGAVSEAKAYDFGKALKRIQEYLDKEKLLNSTVKRAIQKVVISHSLAALSNSEKDPEVHKKVYIYIKDDIFSHFKIASSMVEGEIAERVELILDGNYEAFVMHCLQETKRYLFSRLEAVGWLEGQVKSKDEEIARLQGEIGYLKSTKGMIRTPISKVYRHFKSLTKHRS